VRDAMLAFDGPHQVNLFSYFCGYPQHALDMMADEEVTMEETIALLDTLYPPHKNEEKVRPVAKKIVATTVHIQGESLAEVSPGVASSTDYPLSWLNSFNNLIHVFCFHIIIQPRFNPWWNWSIFIIPVIYCVI
jgi:hypothetical protein